MAWRRLAVCIVAIAVLSQGLTLFHPAAREASQATFALQELSQLPGVSATDLVLCLHDNQQDDTGKTPARHHGADDCPLCQSFGHSTAAAPDMGGLAAPVARQIEPKPIMARANAPRAASQLAGRPRGPPVIV